MKFHSKNVSFLHLFSNECILIFYLKKKPQPYKKRKDFVGGHYIIFSIFFCLVMFHESYT